jgi:DNA replicative helicase MCM subunit Mcm2 (Cdc46/Mcm family)
MGKTGMTLKRHGVHEDLPFDLLKKYIAYARSKCAPKLSA